jgi:hypothetical protein
LNKLRDETLVTNIRGDGDFENVNFEGINFYTNSDANVQHNRVVDRVIRTIRDAIGSNYNDFNSFENVSKIVDIYNKTPHRSLKIGDRYFAPEQVQNNHDLEGFLIRQDQEQLEKVKQEQDIQGLFNYKPGNVLLVHLDYSRTPYSFTKSRRTFNAIAQFLNYEHGNVRVKILNPFNLIDDTVTKAETNERFNVKKSVVIPIYYSKFLSTSVRNIPGQYRNYFL